ncbi:MAG: hypothetical protein NVS2B2_15440 [Ktedonobacteraceae bacterium]
MSIVFEEKRDTDEIDSFANSITTRDIIIVTGCNTVGKTSASCHLKERIAPQHTFSMSQHVADSQSLLEAMQQDDRTGGFHHTHDWCVKGSKGHSHEHGKALFPFTVLDNKLPNDMRTHFFEKLVSLSATGELWFAEWAAGVNTNSSPLSLIDYSYATARKTLEETNMSSCLLKRILAVVHIEAEMPVRSRLNRQRSLPSTSIVEEIQHGTAFWQKDEIVLQFYGKDDFYTIADMFKDEGIPMYTIKNDGTPRFFNEQLAKVEQALQEQREVVSLA